MFKAISTGKNPNYGCKGKLRAIADVNIVKALQEEWIENNVFYLGKQQRKSEEQIEKLLKQ